MATNRINQKVEKLKKRINLTIIKNDGNADDIHKIRICSREILSLLNHENLYCPSLKKIIKLSNKIRDIDVCLKYFIPYIPMQYQTILNTSIISKILYKKRNKRVKIFLQYLRGFLKEEIVFLELGTKKKEYQYTKVSMDINQLHKLRIFIKKLLYIEKNKPNKKKSKIKLLIEIKELLGTINDNHNALNIISKKTQDKILIEKLKKYVDEQNSLHFDTLKKLLSKMSSKLLSKK